MKLYQEFKNQILINLSIRYITIRTKVFQNLFEKKIEFLLDLKLIQKLKLFTINNLEMKKTIMLIIRRIIPFPEISSCRFSKQHTEIWKPSLISYFLF